MIQRIENPRPDYLKVSAKISGQTMAVGNQKTELEIVRDGIFAIFGMSFDDRKRDGTFEFYEKGGVNIVIHKNRKEKSVEATWKGFYWHKTRGYLLVKVFIHYLKQHGIAFKIHRLDIRRNFFADKVGDPLWNLRKGYWINRASAESFFCSEIFNKGDVESVGSYFKSEHFTVNTYNKTKQTMITFAKRILRLKKDEKKRPLEIAMKRHRQVYGDQKVFRFEVKITSPDIADNFRLLLESKSDETDFCTSVLETFNRSYPMKNDEGESKNYKLFFQRGIYEKAKRIA